LQIFSGVAQFSYFPSNVSKDIDGSFKVTPLTVISITACCTVQTRRCL